MGPLPLLVPPLSRHVLNVKPSPPPQQQTLYYSEMVAAKALLPAKFCADMKNLEGWILQIDDYFIIIQTHNKQQRFTFVGLCTEEEALEWWKANRYRYTA